MRVTSKITGLDRATAKIRAIGPLMKTPMRDLLTREARLVAISCAKSTQPYGSGKGAQDQGRDRVSTDIYKVYTTPGKAFADIADKNAARGFWKAIQRGDITKAQAILDRNGSSLRGVPIQAFDGGSAHKSARSLSSGRVSQKRPGMIVRSTQALKSYIAKKQDLVGFAKSAWVTIARKLVSVGATRGLKSDVGDIGATWISGKDAPGTVAWSGDEQNPVVTLTSKVRYASQVLPQAARSAAVAIARDRLVKNLEIAAKAELKKLPNAA
jgi:hypothetical protein